MEVLHDVGKHLRSIEELYRSGMTDKAMEYTKQIGSILKPLVPEEYSALTERDITTMRI